METVRLDDLPSELRSRITAATGSRDYLRVQRRHGHMEAMDCDIYFVEALTGDRVVLMRLWQGPDGSVDECTETFTTADVVEVTHEDRDEVVVRTGRGLRRAEMASDMVSFVESALPELQHA